MGLKRIVADRDARPHSLDYLIFGDKPSLGLDEDYEDFERTFANRCGDTMHKELTTREIQLDLPRLMQK